MTILTMGTTFSFASVADKKVRSDALLNEVQLVGVRARPSCERIEIHEAPEYTTNGAAVLAMSNQFGRGTVLKEVRTPEAVMTDFCGSIADGVVRTWPEALPNGFYRGRAIRAEGIDMIEEPYELWCGCGLAEPVLQMAKTKPMEVMQALMEAIDKAN